MKRRDFFAAFGLLGASAATAEALPSSSTWIIYGHEKDLVLTRGVRQAERSIIDDEDNQPEWDDLTDALQVLKKYGCTGVFLPHPIAKRLNDNQSSPVPVWGHIR